MAKKGSHSTQGPTLVWDNRKGGQSESEGSEVSTIALARLDKSTSPSIVSEEAMAGGGMIQTPGSALSKKSSVLHHHRLGEKKKPRSKHRKKRTQQKDPGVRSPNPSPYQIYHQKKKKKKIPRVITRKLEREAYAKRENHRGGSYTLALSLVSKGG